MSLTSPAVNAVEIEKSVMTLLDEWLRKWFDGNPHTLGTNPDPVTFPTATVRCQQSALPQPLTGAGITAVWVTGTNVRTFWEGGQQLALDHVAFFLLVRATTDLPCRTASDALFALLRNPAGPKELAGKGIHKITPGTPQLISDGKGSPGTHDPNYSTRLVSVKALLRYVIRSQ